MDKQSKEKILSKIKYLKEKISEIIKLIEQERLENNSEDRVILQHLEDKKELLTKKIDSLQENLAQLDESDFQQKSFTLKHKGRKKEFTIVLPSLTNPGKGYISMNSPLAQALDGKQKGEKIKVTTPFGEQEFLILESR
ncbi:hypothetical protein GF362_04620 [Candidatus Dojkabacteria bacterium]|nr:hypothetical protein [Candidatus Dojkabacteria bacterium]